MADLIAVWYSHNDGLQFWNEQEGYVSEKSKATTFAINDASYQALWDSGWTIVDMTSEPKLGQTVVPLGGRFSNEIPGMRSDLGKRGEIIQIGNENSVEIAVTQADLAAERGWWYARGDFGIVIG